MHDIRPGRARSLVDARSHDAGPCPMSITILSPLAGWATPLAEVPDPVFAERMLGDGIAIDPIDGRLVAPGDGVVISIHPAGHAVTVRLDAGPVLLLHVGLETVGLGGAGFTP